MLYYIPTWASYS